MQSVATISAGNDTLIGNLIAEALDAVGADGVLSIETGNSLETTVEVQEGMLIDRGYISPQFVTNQVQVLLQRPNIRSLLPKLNTGFCFAGWPLSLWIIGLLLYFGFDYSFHSAGKANCGI